MAKQPRRFRPVPAGRGVPIDPAARLDPYLIIIGQPAGGRGSILFPSDVPGYSLLCDEIVVGAVEIALGFSGPVRSWRGWAPEVDRADLLLAASNLSGSIPLDQLVDGVREAMRFIGIEDGVSAPSRREDTGRPIDRADAEPRPKPRRKRA